MIMVSKNNHYDPSRLQLFEIVGRIDSDSALALAQSIKNAVASGRDQVLLDMSGVEYMNSAGLRELVKAFKQVQRISGRLILVNPSEYVRRLLELVGLETIFEIHVDPLWDPTRLIPGEMPPVARQMFYYA
jgi:anti-sigma B factor antagonist